MELTAREEENRGRMEKKREERKMANFRRKQKGGDKSKEGEAEKDSGGLP